MAEETAAGEAGKQQTYRVQKVFIKTEFLECAHSLSYVFDYVLLVLQKKRIDYYTYTSW